MTTSYPPPSFIPPESETVQNLFMAPAVSVLNLGQDLPLDLRGESHEGIDQKGVSIRWFIASIIIAFAGALLIGSSIVIAMRGVTSPVQPARSFPHIYSRIDGNEVFKKADKILRSEVTVSAKSEYKAPTQIMTANGNMAIKNRQFIRLSTNLALRTGVYATNIPKFNANRLLNQHDGDESLEANIPVEVSDADVSITRIDLSDIPIPDNAPTWNDDEIALQVNRQYDYWGSSNLIPSSKKLDESLSLLKGKNAQYSYSSDAQDFFPSIDVRFVPENVTQLKRSTPQQINAFFEEKNIIFRKGDSFDTILQSLNVTSQQAKNIIAALGGEKRLETLMDGQYVRALLAPLGTKLEGKSLVRIMILGERGIEAIAAANDRGNFVSVAPPVAVAESSSDQNYEEEDVGREGARLYESVYETLAKNDLPHNFADDFVRIFGWEIDFQRRVTHGDSIEIFYSRDEDNTAPPEILFASLTIGGDHRAVFRYQAKDSSVDFFDAEGRSLKKFLLRKPVAEAVLRSNFGLRFHPILKYSRLHAGVDWAGKIGTPIYAAGNGTVIKAARSSGYGNRIEIQHANGYVSTYSHQSRFAAGIEEGVKVKQGQLIGYIGNTGLSTGPHLHYEVKINGRFVDPMTIKVPRTQELSGIALDDFKAQRGTVIEQIKKTGVSSLSYARASND